MNQVTIPVGDMTCAACTSRVERAVLKLEGVATAQANLASEKVTVVFDPERVRVSDIKATIRSAGYRTLDPSTTKRGEERQRKDREVRILWQKFFVSALFAVPGLYLAMAPMLMSAPPLIPHWLHPHSSPLVYSIVSAILIIPCIAAGNRFYRKGFFALFRLSPTMDSLIAIGTSAAVIYSMVAVFQVALGDASAAGKLYFDSAAMIITLILLGKSMEAMSKDRTSDAIARLIDLAPDTAVILFNGIEREILIEDVQLNDVVLVRPGSRVPVDGIVILGTGSVDESMLTGESMPVSKKPGDKLYAATMNATGALQFKATGVGEDTTLAKIIRLVEDAQGVKAPIARLADRVSAIFVPIVMLFALLITVIWLIVTRDIAFALSIFIAVLVIACPCALGLATPTAIMVATGKGAELGILIKSGEALEIMGRLHTVVFDKTGTVTQGQPQVTDIVAVQPQNSKALLALAAAAEMGSEHPLGAAIVTAARAAGVTIPEAKDFKAVPGKGIIALIDGHEVQIGNGLLMQEAGVDLAGFGTEVKGFAAEGKTPLYLLSAGLPLGVLAVADVVKPDSKTALEHLKESGVEIAILTGDNRLTAEFIARQVGVDRVFAEVLPEQKSEKIKALQAENKLVAMVGDGINDAPALAQADVGIAIGSGTDVAIESADVVLMHSSLKDVQTAIQLSRKTLHVIRQNLFWAFGYNVVCIPIAAGLLFLFGGPLLNPMIAAAAMSLSSVSVLLNALRLKRFKPASTQF